jgi:hypothetical protein
MTAVSVKSSFEAEPAYGSDFVESAPYTIPRYR